jgi:hypothetical protein
MSCLCLPSLGRHRIWRRYPERTPRPAVDLAARCLSHEAEHGNWQAENDVETNLVFKTLESTHESKGIDTIVSVSHNQ